ncbi:MAG: hypothetical protein DRP64_19750 [Verrucomicrobia bacterium]|nr:MAG: hypothetical protein DRP64_19750 [Verrucomicrobiota bacterium]
MTCFKTVTETYQQSSFRDRAVYEWAWCEKALKQPGKARARYQALLTEFPKSDLQKTAIVELAEMEFEADRHTAGARRLTDVIPKLKDPVLKERALYRLGWCQFFAGDYGKAAKAFETMMDGFPKSQFLAAAAYQAGESRLKQKESATARDHFARAVKANVKETHETALLRLGETQCLTARWEQGEQTYAAFIARYPKSKWLRRAHLGLGWARENRKRYGEAIQAYRKVLKQGIRDDTGARGQFQIGECLFAMNKYDKAIQELIKVNVNYSIPKWNSKALLEMGRALEQKGKKEHAKNHFEEVARKYPQSAAAVVAKKKLETWD